MTVSLFYITLCNQHLLHNDLSLASLSAIMQKDPFSV